MSADPRQWIYRRIAVYITILSSLGIIAGCAIAGGDSPVRIAVVTAMSGLLTLVLMSYVFAPSLDAVWSALAGRFGRGGDAS